MSKTEPYSRNDELKATLLPIKRVINTYFTEKHIANAFYEDIERNVATLLSKTAIEARIEEADTGWHHQKHIEKTGVSKWFVDRKEKLEAGLNQLGENHG